MRSGLEGVYVRFNKRYQEWEVLTNDHIVTASFREEKDANFWATFLNVEAEIQSEKEDNINTLGKEKEDNINTLGKASKLGEHISDRLYP